MKEGTDLGDRKMDEIFGLPFVMIRRIFYGYDVFMDMVIYAGMMTEPEPEVHPACFFIYLTKSRIPTTETKMTRTAVVTGMVVFGASSCPERIRGCCRKGAPPLLFGLSMSCCSSK